jgi:hypothetical protein
MSKRMCAVLAVVAVSGWMPSLVHAQQPGVPAPQMNNKQQDDHRASEYLPFVHVAAHGLTRWGSGEAPPRVVPEGPIPASKFRFNPAEFRTTPTGISELAPAVRGAGSWVRGGGKGLLAGLGGGLAAFFGALFGRGKKGPRE